LGADWQKSLVDRAVREIENPKSPRGFDIVLLSWEKP